MENISIQINKYNINIYIYIQYLNIHDVHGHIVVTSNMHKQSLPHTKTHIHMHIHTYTHTNTNKHTLPRIAKTKSQHLQQKHFHQQSHQQKLNAAAISAKAQKLNIFFRPDAPKSNESHESFFGQRRQRQWLLDKRSQGQEDILDR